MNGFLITALVLVQVIFIAIIAQVDNDVEVQLASTVENRYRGNMGNYVDTFKADVRSLLRDYKVNSVDFTKGLRCHIDGQIPPEPTRTCSNEAQQAAAPLVRWKKFADKGDGEVWAKIVGVSSLHAPQSYVDVQICRKKGSEQEGHLDISAKKLRLRLGNRAALGNAVTGHKINCAFCHAQVYGNVVEYGPSMNDNLHNSWIFGKWLVAQPRNSAIPATSGSDPPFKIASPALSTTAPYSLKSYDAEDDSSVASEGGSPTGYVYDYQDDYDGGEILLHYQRMEKALPKFDPTAMKNLATGTARGSLTLVPMGGRFATDATTMSMAEGVVRGNLVLDGRSGGPIQLNGTIMATGDVVIFGKYTGHGSIYAGGNIYIPDNLTATNPAPLFDGSQVSNMELSKVSDPVQAENLANKYWEHDRLFLAATNNIILGDPWPLMSQPSTINTATGNIPILKSEMANDLRYITKIQMAEFQGQFAYDKKTGWMADVITDSFGNPTCFLLPWETEASCVKPNTQEFKDQFIFTPLLLNPTTDKGRIHNHAGTAVPPAYFENFLPKNISNTSTGSVGLWVSEANFKSNFHNVASINQAHSPMDGCNRRRRYLSLRLPLEETISNPHDPDNYDANMFMNIVNKHLNFGQHTKDHNGMSGDNLIPYTEYEKDPVKWKGDELLRNFFFKCVESFQGKKPVYPTKSTNAFVDARYNKITPNDHHCPGWPGVSERLEDRYRDSNWAPIKMDGSNPSAQFKGDLLSKKVCSFWFQSRVDKESSSCAPAEADAGSALKLELQTSTGLEATYNCADPAFERRGLGGVPSFASGGPRDGCYQTLNRYDYYRFQSCQNAGACRTTDINGNCTDYCNSSPPCDCGYNCPQDGYAYKWERDPTFSNYPKYSARTPSTYTDPISGGSVNFPTAPFASIQDAGDADFYIEIGKWNDKAPPLITISTRVWPDSLKDKVVQPKISQVDAFLFSNQFISYATSATSDRTLEINGGMIAKDVLGRHMSRLGHERDWKTSSFPSSAANWGQAGGYIGTGIMVRQDPRVQFAEEFIYQDFGVMQVIDAPSESCP